MVESYKTTYGHKADITVVLMSVVEGRGAHIEALPHLRTD
jgi:hypothetical protein